VLLAADGDDRVALWLGLRGHLTWKSRASAREARILAARRVRRLRPSFSDLGKKGNEVPPLVLETDDGPLEPPFSDYLSESTSSAPLPAAAAVVVVFFLRPLPPREPRRVLFLGVGCTSTASSSVAGAFFVGARVGFSASRSAVIGSSSSRCASASVAYAVPSRTRSTRTFTFLPTSFPAFATQTSKPSSLPMPACASCKPTSP